MRPFLLVAPLLLPLIAACAAPSATVESASAPRAAAPALAPVARPAFNPGLRQATVHMMPGLETMIGATQAELTRQFGAPRLDVWEGDARKLQFAGETCVLDVYLYPKARGGEPEATYVEARRASTGAEADRAGCVAALRPAAPSIAAPSPPASKRKGRAR